ncbi:MAG TPA: dihydroorotate dehydrogenase [Candidatus Saccharimonadales bacterium]|nr:dihydroorotate dehydrogenase [Candidatus Saccharimonadales bacterium]
MPWRRPRKSVERPIDVSRALEQSLEDAADGEELDDTVELADVDGASVVEASTGEPDVDTRMPTEIETKLRAATDATARREMAVVPGSGPRGSRYPESGIDLAVDAARGLRLRNPVLTASGTFGQGVEYAELFDVARLGAFVNKGTTVLARPGNRQYRIAETPSGILNSIGLENPGAAAVARTYGRQWAGLGVPVIVNVAGYSVDDYVTVVREMAGIPGVVAYELNISCPNVKGGMLFGFDPELAAEVTAAVKQETDLPVIVKLTPNAPDVVAVALAVEEAGADAVTAINTVLGMRIDTTKRRPVIGSGSGGLSGPAIRPIAVHLTYQVARRLRIPVIGAGGVTSANDALEFLMAGASAVQVGTATFADPLAPIRVIEGLADYVRENKLSSIRDIIGSALPPPETDPDDGHEDDDSRS